MILAFEIAVIAVCIAYCFIGYRIARILLPVCGAVILFCLTVEFFPESAGLGNVELLVLAGSLAAFFYVALFMLKRVASIIVGFVSVLSASVYVFSLFDIGSIDIAASIVITISLLNALLCFFYQRGAVIAAMSVLGGSIGTLFVAVLAQDMGAAGSSIAGVMRAAADIATTNTLPVSIAALGTAGAGMLIQFFVLSDKTVLPSRSERRKAASVQNAEAGNTKRRKNSFV